MHVRWFARHAVVLVLLSAACEVVVAGDPPFTCSGDGSSVCPAGQQCVDHACVACAHGGCGGDSGTSSEAGPNEGGAGAGNAAGSGGSGGSGGSAGTGGGGAGNQGGSAGSGAGGSSGGGSGGTGGGGGGGAIGAPCGASADCASHLCGVTGVLSSPATAGVCTETCCSSVDCPSGFVCYGGGTGGNYCVSATALGLAAASGGGIGGSSCTGGADCRSGLCVTGACVDTCCADANCAIGAKCALVSGVHGHATFVCSGHGGLAPRADCTSAAACASDLCVVKSCRGRCCGERVVGTQTTYCLIDAAGSDLFAYDSAPAKDTTRSLYGAPCTTDEQCRSRACNIDRHTCSDVCCTDADCTIYGSAVCRPGRKEGAASAMILLCGSGP